MLKFLLSTTAYEALTDDLKTHYSKDGDSYKLKVDGLEDTGALSRAKDREKQKAAELQVKLDEATEKLEAIEGSETRKNKDIDGLTKQYEKKLAEQKTASDTIIASKDNYIKTQLVDNKAQSIASKISTNPDLILPHIVQRLLADFDGDEPVTKVKGKDGKLSNMSIDDLEKELVADARFSAIIKASSGSGGGAGSGSGNGGGGAPPSGKTFKDMTGAERTALFMSNREEFDRQKTAFMAK